MPMKLIIITALISFTCSDLVRGQKMELDVLNKIQTEGFQNSQVMGILSELSDVYGPRLTGSDMYLKAAEWSKTMMEDWDLDDVHFERYCPDCKGWDVKSFNVEMVEPSYMGIIAYPMAWTKSSDGQVTGEVIQIRNPKEEDSVREAFDGRLDGKVILLGPVQPANMLFEPLNKRFTEEQLQTAVAQTDPMPDNPIGHMAREPIDEQIKAWSQATRSRHALFKWFEAQGALGFLTSSHLYPGIAHPSGTAMNTIDYDPPLPYFSIAPEHYGRLVRLLERGLSLKVKFNLETDIYHRPENNVNVIAELKGTDRRLRDEVVMIGGHFDSWHAGTGATDNGAGVAVMMEVMRILKSTGVELRRTIRLGFWGAEEQRFEGSMGYARDHFGELKGPRKPEVETISTYLNMDNGAGAVRGVYLQGNETMRPIFKKILTPFDSLGATSLTIQNADFTDHDVFDFYGIPAFQIIQDPMNYMTVTHHTTMDLLEYISEDDLKKNAVVIAWMVYNIANLEEKLPRK